MNRFEKIIEILKEREMTITFAESCTGGLLAKTFTDNAGVSDVFLGSAVTYANTVKSQLIGVKEETLEAHGAVSRQTAYEMVKGAKSVFGADVAVSVTGIAGPGGGSDEKPVGLVYVGISTPTSTNTYEFRADSSLGRVGIRDAVLSEVCRILQRTLENE